MVDRVFTMTRAARAAVLDATLKGLTLNLTHIAIGSGKYAPTDTQTTLQAEKLRLPIGEAQKDAAALQLNLGSVFRATAGAEFYVSEVGVYAGAMLVFVWSDPANDAWITYLKSDLDFLLNVAIAVPDLPTGAVTITDNGQAIGLNLTPIRTDIAKLASNMPALGVNRSHPVAAWSFGTGLNGWSSLYTSVFAPDPDGSLRVTGQPEGVTGEVLLYSPSLSGVGVIQGSDYRYVLVEVENVGTVTLSRQWLRYRTPGPTGHSDDAASVGAYPIGGQVAIQPGERRVLVYDMWRLRDGSTTDWRTSRITRLRLDMSSNKLQDWKLHRVTVVGPDAGADTLRNLVAVVTQLWVDPAIGDDDNAGTAAAPLKTVAAAIRLAPPNRRTEITLAPGSINDLTVAQFPALSGPTTGGRIHLRGQEIVIFGPYRPADAAQQPTLRFLASIDSAGVVCPRFVGTGSVVFSSIKTTVPLVPTGGPAVDFGVGIGSAELQNVLNFVHYEGALVLSDMPAYVANGGLFGVTLQACAVTFQAGVTPGKLLRITNNSPAVLNMLGGSAPAGIAYKQLVSLFGTAALQADNTPRGLLTNVSFA